MVSLLISANDDWDLGDAVGRVNGEQRYLELPVNWVIRRKCIACTGFQMVRCDCSKNDMTVHVDFIAILPGVYSGAP